MIKIIFTEVDWCNRQYICSFLIVQKKMFVSFWVTSLSRIFHPYGDVTKWRVANYDLYSALMAIEQWGFLSVPHLLWHRASVCNGHLRGSMTLTPIAEPLAMELSLPVFNDLSQSRLGFKHPTFCMQGERSYQLRHHSGHEKINHSPNHKETLIQET